MGVGDSEAFDGAVEGKGVGQVSVIEPEAGGGDQDGPVGGMSAMREREQVEAEGREEENGEMHFGG